MPEKKASAAKLEGLPAWAAEKYLALYSDRADSGGIGVAYTISQDVQVARKQPEKTGFCERNVAISFVELLPQTGQAIIKK